MLGISYLADKAVQKVREKQEACQHVALEKVPLSHKNKMAYLACCVDCGMYRGEWE